MNSASDFLDSLLNIMHVFLETRHQQFNAAMELCLQVPVEVIFVPKRHCLLANLTANSEVTLHKVAVVVLMRFLEALKEISYCHHSFSYLILLKIWATPRLYSLTQVSLYGSPSAR
jgi:hypothetical protein